MAKEDTALKEVESGQARRRRRATVRRRQPTAEELQKEGWFTATSRPSKVRQDTVQSGLKPSLYRGAALEAIKMQLIMASVAGSTSKAYEASWKHWTQFRTLRGEDPFLYGTSPREEEEVLLTYITFLHAVQGNAYSTIKNKVMAIP